MSNLPLSPEQSAKIAKDVYQIRPVNINVQDLEFAYTFD